MKFERLLSSEFRKLCSEFWGIEVVFVISLRGGCWFEIRKIVVSDLDLFLSLLGVGFIVVVSLDVLIFFRDYNVSGQRRSALSRSLSLCLACREVCYGRCFKMSCLLSWVTTIDAVGPLNNFEDLS